MITKIHAAILYGYGYSLVDNEGNVWDIVALRSAQRLVLQRTPLTITIGYEEIGSTYKILCRPIEDLNKYIEGAGVPLIELAKIAYSDMVNENTVFVIGNNIPNSVSITSSEHMDIWMCLSDGGEFCTLEGQVQNQFKMFNWLRTNLFNLDFPSGTTQNLI